MGGTICCTTRCLRCLAGAMRLETYRPVGQCPGAMHCCCNAKTSHVIMLWMSGEHSLQSWLLWCCQCMLVCVFGGGGGGGLLERLLCL